jgi:hypothetical protein
MSSPFKSLAAPNLSVVAESGLVKSVIGEDFQWVPPSTNEIRREVRMTAVSQAIRLPIKIQWAL